MELNVGWDAIKDRTVGELIELALAFERMEEEKYHAKIH